MILKICIIKVYIFFQTITLHNYKLLQLFYNILNQGNQSDIYSIFRLYFGLCGHSLYLLHNYNNRINYLPIYSGDWLLSSEVQGKYERRNVLYTSMSGARMMTPHSSSTLLLFNLHLHPTKKSIILSVKEHEVDVGFSYILQEERNRQTDFNDKKKCVQKIKKMNKYLEVHPESPHFL